MDISSKFTILVHNFFINRNIILVCRDLKPYKLISCFLKLRCNNIFFCCHIHCKRNQCRWYINMLKCSGHTVFSTDRRKTKSKLCTVSTKKCCEWLAPSMWILCHTAEVLLECETDLTVISSCCHNFGYRLCHCVNSSVVRTPCWQIRIESETHHCNRIAVSCQYRKLCNHSLCLCHLILSAMWHKYRRCSNGTVKHFHKTFLWAHIQIF